MLEMCKTCKNRNERREPESYLYGCSGTKCLIEQDHKDHSYVPKEENTIYATVSDEEALLAASILKTYCASRLSCDKNAVDNTACKICDSWLRDIPEDWDVPLLMKKPIACEDDGAGCNDK